MAGHYSVDNLKDFSEIELIFADGPDEMNWIFLSTSGVHGSYETLDDVEANWDSEGGNYITVLAIHPRMVWSRYGHIEIPKKSDIQWLRQMATESLEAVKSSQQGNLLRSHHATE